MTVPKTFIERHFEDMGVRSKLHGSDTIETWLREYGVIKIGVLWYDRQNGVWIPRNRHAEEVKEPTGR